MEVEGGVSNDNNNNTKAIYVSAVTDAFGEDIKELQKVKKSFLFLLLNASNNIIIYFKGNHRERD